MKNRKKYTNLNKVKDEKKEKYETSGVGRKFMIVK